jgi:hypothetical protein
VRRVHAFDRVTESAVAPVRQVSREDHAEEQSSGGFPSRVVARLARLDYNWPEPLTPAQVMHAVHALVLQGCGVTLLTGSRS